jgi:hypothetical protein
MDEESGVYDRRSLEDLLALSDELIAQMRQLAAMSDALADAQLRLALERQAVDEEQRGIAQAIARKRARQ